MEAKKAPKDIYDHYKEKSIQGAKNVRADLLQAPRIIQYQVDDINPNIVESWFVILKFFTQNQKVRFRSWT